MTAGLMSNQKYISFVLFPEKYGHLRLTLAVEPVPKRFLPHRGHPRIFICFEIPLVAVGVACFSADASK